MSVNDKAPLLKINTITSLFVSIHAIFTSLHLNPSRFNSRQTGNIKLKKCENKNFKLNFPWTQLSEMHGAGKFLKFRTTDVSRYSRRQTMSLQIFKGSLPQILPGPFLKTLTQILIRIVGSNQEANLGTYQIF